MADNRAKYRTEIQQVGATLFTISSPVVAGVRPRLWSGCSFINTHSATPANIMSRSPGRIGVIMEFSSSSQSPTQSYAEVSIGLASNVVFISELVHDSCLCSFFRSRIGEERSLLFPSVSAVSAVSANHSFTARNDVYVFH